MRYALSWLLSVSIVAAAVIAPTLPAEAATNSTAVVLTKSAPTSILAGGDLGYSLNASNEAGTVPEYNVALRDVLPAGVTYVPGSTTPSSAGEPTVFADKPAKGQTTLVWPDVFDLQAGDSNGISFKARPNVATKLVGDTVANTGYVYSNKDPRTVPSFDGNGVVKPGSVTGNVSSNAVSTKISALTASKSEPSPESKLLRGVHNQSTIYTITVSNNAVASTNGVTVTDYLPANLEFLGCGAVDNTTAQKSEYPGAPSLSATPAVPALDRSAPKATGCVVPASVETVTNPAGYAAGVYTKVVWSLGAFAAGETVKLQYAAGVPLRNNVAFTTAPTPASGLQTANLDNNTGASTRQDGDAKSATNFVSVTGSYTGGVMSAADRNVKVDVSNTVTIHDLRIIKTVDQSVFHPGNIAKFTLTIDASEYVAGSNIVVTDTLPNGLCPLGAINYGTGSAPSCAPVAGQMPSVDYKSVTQNDDGSFSIVFNAIPSIAANGTATITYPVMMRKNYADGTPTSAGDSFTNNAAQKSDTTPIAGNTVDPGTKSVTDSSNVSLGTGVETLSKEIGTRTSSVNCDTATYGDNQALPAKDTTFVRGDRVCFKITVNFSKEVETRNPVVTDFLPHNLSFDDGSWHVTSVGASVPADQIAFSNADGALTWQLGKSQAGDKFKTVPTGAVFQVVFSATVNEPSSATSDKSGNVAKFRAMNSAGKARSLRDEVDFWVDPTPIAMAKTIATVNGVAPANNKSATVQEGDALVFNIAVRNTSGATSGTVAQDITNPEVWDVLPAPLKCADISGISDAGACVDPDATTPSNNLPFAGSDKLSAIRWKTTGVKIAPGATKTLSYSLKVPAGISHAETIVNRAAVRSYIGATNKDDKGITYFPGQNIDTTVPVADQDPKPAADTASMNVRAVSLTKGVTSAVNESGNTGSENAPAGSTQATIGELVTYTVTAQVPAGSTVFNAALRDPMPTGLALVSVGAAFAPDATTPVFSDTLPGGVTFAAGKPELTFGTSYSNRSDKDQQFRLLITARVLEADATNKQGVKRTNTATFSSDAGGTGRTDPADVVASAGTNIVEPKPAITKANDKATAGLKVVGGDTVSFSLKASNAAGSSTLHNAWAVDCMPAGLTFVAYGDPSQGTTLAAQKPAPGPGGNNTSCAPGTTQLAWNVGTLAPGATATLIYTATVDTDVAGNVQYTNNVFITGNSLEGERATAPAYGDENGRSYVANGNSSVTVAGATTTKTVDKAKAEVGQKVTYTVNATLPASVNFYNATVMDTLPQGIDVGSVSLLADSITCKNVDDSACTITSASQLAANGQSVAFLLGDIQRSNKTRVVTFKYTALVANDTVNSVVGKILTNSARVAWDVDNRKPGPTDSSYPFQQTGPDSKVNVTVLEPKLSIEKSVSNAKPQPGETFSYSVKVQNWNNANASAAHNVVITDNVPSNVVVDGRTISHDGVIAGNDPVTGGGTITWTLPGSLAINAAVTLSYSAKLAPSSGLTAAGLVNTANIAGYDSLPTGGRHYEGPSSKATVTPNFPKLTAAKTSPNGGLAYLGQPFDWQVTVSNAANAGIAYKAGAVDTLPEGWSYKRGTARVSVNGGAATAVEPAVDGLKLSWANLGQLAAGTKLVINYQAVPGNSVIDAPGVGMGIKHTNTAAPTGQDATGATGNEPGPYSGNPVSADAEIASADLSIVKAVGTAPVAGSTGSWTMTVTNNGEDTAVGPFTVVDTGKLPTGVTLTAISGTGWTCSLGTLTCSTGDSNTKLAKGASLPAITLGYSVAANVADGTSYANTASVSGGSYDPKTENNTSTATTTVSAQADLGLVKTLTTPMVAGQTASYSLTVTNYGPSDSIAGISVKETVPEGTIFVSAAGTDWKCAAPAEGVAACTYGKVLAAGATAPAIMVTILLPSSMTAAVTNTATVTGVTPEPENPTHPNTDTVTTTPEQSADLAIVKTRDTALVAGAVAEYTLAVTNYGPSDARKVVVTDTLDPSLSFESSTGDDWICAADGQLVTCSYKEGEPFPATEIPTTSKVVLKVRVAQTLSTPVANTAVVSSQTPDPVPGNNTSTSPGTETTGEADLSISKSHSGNAVAGSNLEYTLSVHNDGPSTVSGELTVYDTLPAGMSFVSFAGDGWDCTVVGQVVTCLGADGLITGADDSVVITVKVAQDVAPGTLINTATVSAPELTPDPNPSNNGTEDPTEVVQESAISLSKKLESPAPVVTGTKATFNLAVSNDGPSDATTVIVTDTLPEFMTFTSATGEGWTCTNDGQSVSCSRDVAVAGPAGSIPAITVVALIDSATPVDAETGEATLVNTAALTTGSTSTITNPPAVDVPVIAQADLELVKTGASATAVAGTDFTWNFAVKNNGSSDAAGPLTITDTLPAFQSLVSATGTGWDCVAGDLPEDSDKGQTLTCTIESGLVAGASAEVLAVKVHIDASAPADEAVTNTAVVASPTADVVPENNRDSATVQVEREQKLAIVKSHTGNGVIGSTLEFQIAVSNQSPSTATQIHVEDALPEGLSFVSAEGEGWSCESVDGVISCEYDGVLLPNAAAPVITVVTKVDVAAYPSVVNKATVSSKDPALPGKSTSEDPVTVDPAASLQIKKTHQGALTAGHEGSYLIEVSNTGLTESPGPVVVEDVLPEGLHYKAAVGDGWTAEVDGQKVTLTRAGALAVGKAEPITLSVDVLPAAFPSVENTALVSGPGSEPASSTDVAEVGPDVAWTIEKTLKSYKDNKATYSITVKNTGANPTVTDTVVVDKLPAGLSYISFAGDGWICSADGSVVTCTLAESIEAGGSRTLELVTSVTAAPGTTISNVATVTGGGSSTGVVEVPIPDVDPGTDPTPKPSTDPSTDPSTGPSTGPSTDPSTDPSTGPGTHPSGHPGGNGGTGSIPSAGSDPADVTVTPEGELPNTGAPIALTVAIALLLMLGGAGTLVMRRRPMGSRSAHRM